MKIALTYTGTEQKHQNYINWLKSYPGATTSPIEVIRLSHEQDNLKTLKKCDALLLSGGIDIDPQFYGKKKAYENAPPKFNRKRDVFEAKAFEIAQQEMKPVLGVCRGMQLLNVLSGGTLKQDLGNGLNRIHRAKDLIDMAHGVNIVEGSLLHDILKEERAVVNSAHHQSVKKIGKGLKVNCVADDGTIEGIERSESNGAPFLLGVQWHPERLYKFHLENSAAAAQIRDRFIEAIKNSI